MHKSLTLRTNYSLALAMALVVALCVALGTGIQFALITPFLVAGIAGGLLQGRAVRSAPTAFLAAESWSSVRSSLASSWPGRLSLALTWANGLGLLLALALYKPTPTVATVLSCCASFMLFRELTAMPSLHQLKALRLSKSAA